MNYEYQEVTVPTMMRDVLIYNLQALGSVGWELVAVTSADPTLGVNKYTAVLRREVRPLPAPAAPGWHADPCGRHGQRYYDVRWTEHVSDDGVTSVDFPTATLLVAPTR